MPRSLSSSIRAAGHLSWTASLIRQPHRRTSYNLRVGTSSGGSRSSRPCLMTQRRASGPGTGTRVKARNGPLRTSIRDLLLERPGDRSYVCRLIVLVGRVHDHLAEPTEQPRSLVLFDGSTSATMTAQRKRLHEIVLANNSAVDSARDGAGYTADTNFGSGSQIAAETMSLCGDGTRDRERSLSLTTYHFAVFELMGSGVRRYLAASPLLATPHVELRRAVCGNIDPVQYGSSAWEIMTTTAISIFFKPAMTAASHLFRQSIRTPKRLHRGLCRDIGGVAQFRCLGDYNNDENSISSDGVQH